MNRRDFLNRYALLAGASLLPSTGWAAEPGAAASSVQNLPDWFTLLHNVDHLEPAPGGTGWRLNRVPAGLWPKLNRPARERAYSPAGSEVRFNLRGSEARLSLRFVEDRSAKAKGWPVLAEIRQGDFLLECVPLQDNWADLVIRRPGNLAKLAAAGPRGQRGFDPELVRVALPYMPVVEVKGLVGDVTPARREQLPGRSCLAYGSSITHGAYALRAGETYPACVARALGVDHYNLGFSAGAYLEPEMADWIAQRTDWDFATLELGVNLITPLSTAEFRSRVEVFLRKIVTAHPDQWIFVIDVFTAGPDFEANPKRAEFRAIVREAVRIINRPKVRYLDGREMFRRTTGLSRDLLHPSAEGFAEIGERLATAIRDLMGAELPAL